ncbi:MAG TPA: WXG100 family type VII secretion target [Solirubrobacteraceae bacterium]|nr:WXG100 family type VII secretion target [Solirubrobacteraceae bacterium]
MSELVIPGSPAGLQALASQLGDAAQDIDSVRDRVAGNGLEGSWSGRAAEAFRSSLHQLPGELAKVGAAFDDAGTAIRSFSSTLAELQEKARWYNERVADTERELQSAHSGHDDAESKLSDARRALSLATDPVSLSSARQLVGAGEDLVRKAVAKIEDIGGSLARYVDGQGAIMAEYEDAVRGCASLLNAARDGGGSALHGVRSWFDHELGHLQHDGAALWRNARRDVRDVEKDLEHVGDWGLRELDKHWGLIRRMLVDISDVVGDVTLALSVVLPILAAVAAATGLGLPVAAFLLGADGLVNEVGTVEGEATSALILEGDSIEAARGNRKYAADLPDDAVNVAVSWIPAHRLFGPLGRKLGQEIDRVPALRDAADRLESTVDRDVSKGVDGAINDLDDKAAHDVRQVLPKAEKDLVDVVQDNTFDKLGDETSRFVHYAQKVISAPLSEPTPIRINPATLQAAAA